MAIAWGMNVGKERLDTSKPGIQGRLTARVTERKPRGHDRDGGRELLASLSVSSAEAATGLGEDRAARGDVRDQPTATFEQARGPTDNCTLLDVVGGDRCPEFDGELLREMLGLKRDMLRRVVDILSDPASAGEGGDPDQPLLLVQKLARDETDAVFGAFDERFLGHTTDSGGWSPLPGGMNRWIQQYHDAVLHRTRPVVLTVHVSHASSTSARGSREISPGGDAGLL